MKVRKVALVLMISLALCLSNGFTRKTQCSSIRDQIANENDLYKIEAWADKIAHGVQKKSWRSVQGTPSIIGEYALSMPFEELPIKFSRPPEIKVVHDEFAKPVAVFLQVERFLGLLVSFSNSGEVGATSPPKKNMEKFSDRVYLVCIERD